MEDGDGVVATYYYDPFGRRLWKDVDGTRTYFLYSDEGLIGEYDATGNEIKTYGWTPDSLWGTDPLFQKIGDYYYFYQNDHQGTPQKLIGTNGLVVWAGVYDSFGNCQVEVDGITNNLRFAGQYYDQETGLHYNLNRYYDPATGRYHTTDPFGDGLNLYAYVFNNPINWIDPLGLCAITNFAAGFGDALTSVFGLTYLFGIPSFTEWARQQLGSDYVVQKGSGAYFSGQVAADVWLGVTTGALASRAALRSAGRGTQLFKKSAFTKEEIASFAEIDAMELGGLERGMQRLNIIAESLSKRGYSPKQIIKMLGPLQK